MKRLTLMKVAVLAMAMSTSHAYADTVYATYIDTSTNPDGFTVRDSSNLSLQYAYHNTALSGAASGLSLLNNNLYITAGNGIYNYSASGSLVNQFTWYDNSLSYTDVTTGNGLLYATYAGSQNGITIRDLTSLNQYKVISTGVAATGIIAGASNDLYITAGNSIYRYGTNGSLLNSFSWSDNTITYTDITIVNDKLYATYTGSQNGITIRDLTTLNQSSFINTGVSASGITAGYANDVYITAGDGIYHYGTNGSLINKFNWGARNITYTDVAVSAVPEPENMGMLAIGLAMIAVARRRKKN